MSLKPLLFLLLLFSCSRSLHAASESHAFNSPFYGGMMVKAIGTVFILSAFANIYAEFFPKKEVLEKVFGKRESSGLKIFSSLILLSTGIYLIREGIIHS